MNKVIFIFRQYANIPYLPGGVRHFKFGKLMVEDGNSVYIFISNFRHDTKSYAKKFKGLYKIENYKGIKFVWINNKPVYFKNDWRRLLGMLDYSLKVFLVAISFKAKAIKPDLIIGSVAHIFAVCSAYLSSLILNSKFWIDLGDLWPASYIQSGVIAKNHPIAIAMSLLSSILYRKAGKIIVLSKNAEKYLLGINVPYEKIILFSNGIVGKNSVKFLKNKVVPIQVTPRSNFIVTYTGALDETHPIDVLIKAAFILKDKNIQLEVEIVGDGVKRSYYQQMITKYGQKNIRLYGPVKREKLKDIYQKADTLIVIEKDLGYGFPNKLIDYSISCKPVIIASGMSYNLPNELYLQTSPTAEKIAEAIMQIYEMTSDDRQAIGQMICKYALNSFNMRKNYIKQIQPLIGLL